MIESKNITISNPTIEVLFQNSCFYIPKYQRDYSWTITNAIQLKNDLEDNDDYYIGNIMVNNIKDSVYELIDGQQRIITLFLMLCAIKNVCLDCSETLFDNNLIFCDNKPRIIIDDRIADSYIKIFNYIANGIDVIDELKTTHEYQVYEKMFALIKNYNYDKRLSLYEKIKNCVIVQIDCKNSSLTPYDVFLNFNTKGVKLSNAEILKSKLFSFLDKDSSFDKYKNSWSIVTNEIGDGNLDDYLFMYISLYLERKSKTSKATIINYLFENLKNIDDAKKMINILGNENSSFFKAYKAVVLGETSRYLTDFSAYSLNLEKIFDSLSYIRKNKYVQFNIAFVSLLTYNNTSEKNAIVRNFHIVNAFVDFVFLYASFKSADNNSPSSYANNFISLSVDNMKNKNEIKNNLIGLLKLFNVKKLQSTDEISQLKKLECKRNSKGLKIAVSLIAQIDGWSKAKFNAEHFYCESSNSSEKFKFGNIIPVNSDNYADADINDKIQLYEKNISVEKSIEIFLNQYKETNFSIDVRTEFYMKKIVEKYNRLLDMLGVIDNA